MVGPGRPQIVLFGSSIVQQSYNVGGWGAILADLYCRKADITLRGYSGWNSRRALEVLHQVFPKDAVVQPSLVIVYFGGNDAMRPHPSGLGTHVPLLEYVENMKKIASHIKCLSKKTRLIFLTSPPVNDQLIDQFFGKSLNNQARTNEACHAYAEALVALGKELNIKVINLWAVIQQRDDWSTACLTDGIHFSKEGSKIVVREILKVLKEAEWKPSLYWLSMPTEFPENSPYYEADVVLRGYAGWNSRNALQVLDQIFHITKTFTLCPKSSDTFVSQARSNKACHTYSEALVELGKHLDIKVINLWTAFQNRDDWGKTYLLDGIHPSSEGSQIVVKEILKVVQEAEWEPSLHWRSQPDEFLE